MVKSVVLAWGSLVSDPAHLQTAAAFAANGPLLPIEFCSVSADGRLTLAIDETFGALCKTYSAPSALPTLDAAIDNLRVREGMSTLGAIGFVEPASGKQSEFAMQRHPQVVATIGAWATANGYDAAIWIAVASNFDDWGKGGEPFSVSAAIQYLETLERTTPPSSPRRSPTFAKRRRKSRPRCASAPRSAGLNATWSGPRREPAVLSLREGGIARFSRRDPNLGAGSCYRVAREELTPFYFPIERNRAGLGSIDHERRGRRQCRCSRAFPISCAPSPRGESLTPRSPRCGRIA